MNYEWFVSASVLTMTSTSRKLRTSLPSFKGIWSGNKPNMFLETNSAFRLPLGVGSWCCSGGSLAVLFIPTGRRRAARTVRGKLLL